MSKNYVQLPDSFVKGLLCKVHVSLNGKTGTKDLKVCMVNRAGLRSYLQPHIPMGFQWFNSKNYKI